MADHDNMQLGMDDIEGLECQSPKKTKVSTKVKLLLTLIGGSLATLTLVVTLVPKMNIRQHKVYWARMTIMIVSSLLLLANLSFFCFNARKRGVGLRCPRRGQWWPFYYKEVPDILYFGTPIELVGLTFGLVQTILFVISFVNLQKNDSDPITFSLLQVAYSAVILLTTIFLKYFKPVYKVTTACGGRYHSFVAREDNGKIQGNCTCQQTLEGSDSIPLLHPWAQVSPSGIWIPVLSTKVTHPAIPTNDRIISQGIPVVSRCSCCTSSPSETINQLFASHNRNRGVWSSFQALFLDSFQITLHGMLSCLRSHAGQIHFFHTRTPSIIYREIFSARNWAIFEQEHMHIPVIITSAYHWLKDLLPRFTPTRIICLQDRLTMAQLRLPYHHGPVRIGSSIRWTGPGPGQTTLHFEGPVQLGQGAAGRVFQDHGGSSNTMFASSFGHISLVEAEACAVLAVVNILYNHGLFVDFALGDSMLGMQAALGTAMIPFHISPQL